MQTWKTITQNNPHHSENYAARWRRFKAEGKDIDGEARFIDALAPRHAHILDAGCGTGRVGGRLAECGHQVTGTDIDEVLLAHARHDYPDCRWEQVDIGQEPQPGGPYDVIVLAGNVVGFVDPADRARMFSYLRDALADDGVLVIGYGAGRGWSFRDFLSMAKNNGLVPRNLFSTWDLQPWKENSDFLVAVLSHEKSEAL